MNKKTIFFTIILLAVFLIASILALKAAKKITTTPEHAINTPDFFMTNAIYTKFDQNGNISNRFYTSKISHITENNKFIFENPSMKMHNENEPPWNISALKGKSQQGKSKIYLWGDVKITQEANTEGSDFDISTNSLTVYPSTKFIETDDAITIIQSGSIIKAIGAKADLKAGTLDLLSNVDCQYQTD